MRLYTAQISQYRGLQKAGIAYIDTTVKSGLPLLAPSWDMVTRHKAGTLDNSGYMALYLDKTRQSYKLHDAQWRKIALMDEVAFLCYCPPGVIEHPTFCHRFLLIEMFDKICQRAGIPFEYMGEWIRGEVFPYPVPIWLSK